MPATLIEEALYARLRATAGLMALLSYRNVWPHVVPPGTSSLPGLTYSRVSGPVNYTMSGETGCAEARFQVTAWSRKYDEAKAVDEQVRLSVSGFRGEWDGMAIDSVFCEHHQDVTERDPTSEAITLYGVRRDIRIRFRQTAATH